jgi:hypothetical protein
LAVVGALVMLALRPAEKPQVATPAPAAAPTAAAANPLPARAVPAAAPAPPVPAAAPAPVAEPEAKPAAAARALEPATRQRGRAAHRSSADVVRDIAAKAGLDKDAPPAPEKPAPAMPTPAELKNPFGGN